MEWTRAWLDTEGDGFHGRLLSVGLVTQSGVSFYGALPPIHVESDWAAKHVVPVLGVPSHMDDVALAEDLASWLRQFEAVEVIADWHRDLMHFFELLGPRRPGQQLPTCRIRAALKPWLNGCGDDMQHGPLHHARADAVRLMSLTSLRQMSTA